MSIEQIKKEMLAYIDFFGGDFSDHDAILNATTKEELRDIIDKHRSLLEDMLSDALSHLSNFQKKVKLF